MESNYFNILPKKRFCKKNSQKHTHTGKQPIHNRPPLVFLLSSSVDFVCKQQYNMICPTLAMKTFSQQSRTVFCVNFAGATLELLAPLQKECIFL